LVKSGPKNIGAMHEAKRSILLHLAGRSSQIQYYGLLWHHQQADGFGHN